MNKRISILLLVLLPTLVFGQINLEKRLSKQVSQSTDFDNDLELPFSLLDSEQIDAFYHKLLEPEFKDYTIRKANNKEVTELPKGHFDISLGTFIPTSKAKSLGSHPTLGISGGLKYNRLTYGLTLDMRFGPTKEKYQVLKRDTLTTDYYFGVYFGMDVSYDLIRYKNNELLLLAGFGYDGFDTEFTGPSDDPMVTISSYNLNGGLMYRCYYNDKNYIGISYQYNLVDYNSDKIIENLTGNFHSISISFGGVNNARKRPRLKELRFLEE